MGPQTFPSLQSIPSATETEQPRPKSPLKRAIKAATNLKTEEFSAKDAPPLMGGGLMPPQQMMGGPHMQQYGYPGMMGVYPGTYPPQYGMMMQPPQMMPNQSQDKEGESEMMNQMQMQHQ